MTFHVFPGPRSDSMTYQAWKISILNSGLSRICMHPVSGIAQWLNSLRVLRGVRHLYLTHGRRSVSGQGDMSPLLFEVEGTTPCVLSPPLLFGSRPSHCLLFEELLILTLNTMHRCSLQQFSRGVWVPYTPLKKQQSEH